MNFNSHLPHSSSNPNYSTADDHYFNWTSSPDQSFDVGVFEFWYQPVYQTSTYQIFHNEILLRWKDCQGKVYLPDEFMPILAEMGLFSQLDRYVIDRAISNLVEYPQLNLSVNLSRLAFEDINLIEDLKAWLADSRVEPKRLSFELTEHTITQDFCTALNFIQNLTTVGCLVGVDNFTGRELTLSQCKQLPVDWVKLDHQFLDSIKANPQSVALTRRLREISYTMGPVIVKYIEDEPTLKLIQQLHLDAVQGNQLQPPSETAQFSSGLDLGLNNPSEEVNLSQEPEIEPWGTSTPAPVNSSEIAPKAPPASAPVNSSEIAPKAPPTPAPVNSSEIAPKAPPTPAPVNSSEIAPKAPPTSAPVNSTPEVPQVLTAHPEVPPEKTTTPEKSQIVPTHPEVAEIALATSNSTPAALTPSQSSPGGLTHTEAKPLAKGEHPVLGKKPNVIPRILIGSAFLSVSVATLAVAFTSIWHRTSHIVVKHGVVNGRLVRLQSPIYGHVKEFYARPGALVSADQVLAKIEHIPDEDRFYEEPQIPLLNFKPKAPRLQNAVDDNFRDDTSRYNKLEDLSYEAQQKIVRLQGDLEANRSKLVAVQQERVSIENRLREVEQQYQQTRQAEVNISATEVPQQQAALEQAQAEARLARSEYERFQNLLLEGAVPSQRVDQLKVAWDTAEAEVQKVREELRAAEVAHNAAQQGLAMNNRYSYALSEEASSLRQQLDQKAILVSTLETEVSNSQERLQLAEDEYSRRKIQMQQEQVNIANIRQQREQVRQEQEKIRQEQEKIYQDQLKAQQQAIEQARQNQEQARLQQLTPVELQVKAPFTSVVYRTELEKGELVNRSEAVLSLLDCNSLWVEAVVSSEDASRLDPKKPVQVRLGNHSEVLKGEVDLIQPISTLSTADQKGSFADIDKQGRRMQVQALSPTIPEQLMGESFLKRVTVKVPPPVNHDQPQQLCGLGQVAQLRFARQSNSNVNTVFAGLRQLPSWVRDRFSKPTEKKENPEVVSNPLPETTK